MQRFLRPVPVEGPLARRVPCVRRVFSARMAREVDAGSCE